MRLRILAVTSAFLFLALAHPAAAQFLGDLSANPYAPNSTANRYGAGSPYAPNSVNNPYGKGLGIFGDDK